MKRKHFHWYEHNNGDWSFGIAFTRDKTLDECYVFINFYKWSIAIGKLAYLKEISTEDDT